MPTYEYFCEANGRTVELSHPVEADLTIWGEVCFVAGIALGDTDPEAPVRRVLSRAPGVSVPTSDSELKGLGLTKLVKRDDGVYENVTATDGEARYMKSGDPSTLPHVHKKVRD